MSDPTDRTVGANRLEPGYAATPPSESESVEIGQEAAAASTPFVGQWQTLVSTTNWEKGRIIREWRDALEASGAAATEFSDQAWAQLVGGVTSQHVGRLRRVHQRFGEVFGDYGGLYWSHFQAAIDWDDAEMWLEGAVQNSWSVSQMRGKRWETLGDTPAAAEQRAAEEAAAAGPGDVGEYGEPDTASGEMSGVQSPAEDARESADAGEGDDADSAPEPTVAERNEPPVERVRPFADLAELPEDLAEAFEQFKLAILTHKLTGWTEVPRDDVLGALESLKQLALAPSEEDSQST